MEKEKELSAVEWYCVKSIDILQELREGKMTFTKWFKDQALILKQAKKMEKEQHQETWNVAHQAGRFEGKGIAEENWQTFETHWEDNFKQQAQ